jgi:phosphate transport system substrate-binding protein
VKRLLWVLAVAGLVAGCQREPGSTVLTKGKLIVECDESVWPVMQQEAEEFKRVYPESEISIRPVEARQATVNFVNDSIHVIVCARKLNDEELAALKASKVDFQEYLIARSAVSVLLNAGNPIQQIRLGQLDSLFSGTTTRWEQMRGKPVVDLAIGGIDCSINEVFRTQVMKGRPFALSATHYSASDELVLHVRKTRGAIGIVSPAWLKGTEQDLNVPAVGSPTWRPDTLALPGQYYTPAQAYVFLGDYPIVANVYMYSREIDRNISLGFISFVSSGAGQKVIQKSGLVPAQVPVRIVQLTQDQVR